MSDFVERCRREWRRLGVPAAHAEDMASELAADLEAAGADGVSAQDLLGTAVDDPEAFAASWAAERGVVERRRRSARARLLVAAAALLSVVAIAAGTALLASPPAQSSASALSLGRNTEFTPRAVWVVAPTSTAPPTAIQVFPAPQTPGSGRQTVAWSLLIAGLVALALSLPYLWLRAGQVRRVTS